MSKKKYRINDTFGDGYTEYDQETGEKEHFIKHVGSFSEGYYGNKGSVREVDRLTGMRTIKDKKGKSEVFSKGILTDDYHGSEGTHISKRTYDDGFSVSKKGGKTEHFYKKNGILTTTYESNKGNSYTTFNDEVKQKEKKKEAKNAARKVEKEQLELEAAYRDAMRAPIFSLAIDILILLYAFLALMVDAIPKHDIVCHALLIIGILQFSCVCGIEEVDVSTYLLNIGRLFIPHFFFHLFGIVGARDETFYTYHAIGPTFTIIIVTYVTGIILYILCRNGVFTFLKEKLFRKKKRGEKPSKDKRSS